MAVHTCCRICRTTLPEPFLDFGLMPLANAFLASPEEAASEPRYPLAVAVCARCGLVQLTEVVPAEQLYRRYIYVSSTSEAVKAHATRLAAARIKRHGWGASDLIVEIASNDGTVLKAFQAAGMRVLGVEPARNIASLAQAAGIPTVAEFFHAATAKKLVVRHGRAAGIVARHVFAHVNDLHDFLEGIATLLRDDGVFVIEVPYLGDLVKGLAFDTIYHEHLSYLSLQPVIRLCAEHGFQVVDVERISLHGGSMLLTIQRAGKATGMTPRLEAMLQEEQESRLTNPDTLSEFGRRVSQWKEQFERCVETLNASGATIIGYGAAAKANTLLNYCPAVAKTLAYILDRSPHKHGHLTPGTHIPVVPVETWERDRATHLLILAWNFKEEIMAQMAAFAKRGGRFVIPIPEPEVLAPSCAIGA
ncbi:MAG: class I SAM-dependent methyltransferase [Candidatus Omnitrophica bacterium]|nr:class I SAM-dependent methyltransferase [Candidatus Omnitrophota bacterium]